MKEGSKPKNGICTQPVEPGVLLEDGRVIPVEQYGVLVNEKPCKKCEELGYIEENEGGKHHIIHTA